MYAYKIESSVQKLMAADYLFQQAHEYTVHTLVW